MVDRDGGVGLVLEAPRDGGHLAPCLVEGLVPNSPAANSEEISIGDIVVQVAPRSGPVLNDALASHSI
jgi:hypothetical protein